MAWPKGLDLRALNVFLETARSGNMAVAATRLGMTQPAVSQYISKTEDAVGAPLLDRRLRPTRLTPAGEVLRDRAEALLASAEAAVEAVRNVGEQPLPELRIAVPNSIAATLTPWLYEIARDELRPGNFALRVGQSVDHVRALMEREVDLIVTSDSVESVSGISRFPLFREPFLLMLPAKFDATGMTVPEIADVLPLIRFAGHNAVGQMVDRHLRRMRVSIARQSEFDTAQAAAAMVAAGHGFAIATPMCVLEGDAVGHAVTCAPFPGPAFSRKLHLLARGRELGPRAALFAGVIRRIMRDRVTPMLGRRMPWVGDTFRIIEADE